MTVAVNSVDEIGSVVHDLRRPDSTRPESPGTPCDRVITRMCNLGGPALCSFLNTSILKNKKAFTDRDQRELNRGSTASPAAT